MLVGLVRDCVLGASPFHSPPFFFIMQGKNFFIDPYIIFAIGWVVAFTHLSLDFFLHGQLKIGCVLDASRFMKAKTFVWLYR